MPNWIVTCGVDDVDPEDVIPFEHDGCQYAIYRSPDDGYYATDGSCTHEHALLADGLVIDYRTGEGKCAPIRVNLRTYPTQVAHGVVSIDIE